MCELCQVYLHDYFQQPLEKDNPLNPLVNRKKLQEKSQELSIVLNRFLHKTLNPFLLNSAKSDTENYFTFMSKASNPYQIHTICFAFLKRNKRIEAELKGLQAEILNLDFLKVKRTDPFGSVVEKWLAFVVGSLFQDLYELHSDHSNTKNMSWNLDKGLPGHPWTAAQFKKKQDISDTITVGDPELDDLYT